MDSGGGTTIKAGSYIRIAESQFAEIPFQMSSGGDINLDAGTTLSVSGDVSAVGDVTLDAGTSTTVGGNISAHGHVGLLGTPTIVISSSDLFAGEFDVSSISGDSGVTMVATEALTLDGIVESGDGSIFLESNAISLWSFDHDAAQDTGGYMNAGLGITLKGGSSIFVDLRGENKRFEAAAFSAGTDIDIEAPVYVELIGEYEWGDGAFSTMFDAPLILEFGGSVLFSSETGEVQVTE